MSSETVAIFDDVAGGHHDRFVRGLGESLRASGVRPLLFVPSMSPLQDFIDDASVVAPFTARQPIAGRRALDRALSAAEAAGSRCFVDTNLDKNVWAFPRSSLREPVVHVLHQASQYVKGRGGRIGGLKAEWLRHKLTRLTRCGQSLVVHTHEAELLLSSFLSKGSVRRAGYPVLPRSGRKQGFGHGSGPVRLLFIGGARRQKGLPLLLQAASRLSVPVTIVGPQDGEVRARLEQLVGSQTLVEWVDRFVSDDELDSFLSGPVVVVAPYTSAFGVGAASGVLLDSLAAGVPLVTSSVLASQLPPGYGGAVVVPSDDTLALEQGIQEALDHRSALEEAARREGPRFVAEHHSFDSYVEVLLSSAGLG